MIQEEIVDETDVYIDVHKRYSRILLCFLLKINFSILPSYSFIVLRGLLLRLHGLSIICRIRVAAAAAASSIARAPVNRRITGQKPSVVS